MELIPPLRVTRFEQLSAGDLFILFSGSERFYALKTIYQKDADAAQMVVLGPTFLAGANESFLLNWQASTVLSYGKNFSVMPSADPEDWFENGDRRTPVCLAISDNQPYICTNGGHSPRMYSSRYVNIATGSIESGLSNAVFTTNWRIEVAVPDRSPQVLIKFPSPKIIRTDA